MNEKGQIILTLILVMTVALAIGLSVVQKSLVDVSTSTKVEQSSRAFSAAEAGIEKKLRGDASCTETSCVSFEETGSEATVLDSNLIPAVPSSGTRQDPLEYPPLAKEDVAHVWLADYTSTANPPQNAYVQTSLDIYWGNSATDKAALELTLVYHNGALYQSRKWYLDNPSATRGVANNFDITAVCSGDHRVGSGIYQCKKTIDSLPAGLMLLRARLLYNTTSQPFAVQAVGTCGQDCSIPPQARNITSTGAAGESQRKVNLFQVNKVVPPYFDYAIFSAGEISK
ncbi:pilus assembly PilX N-terminal domain-containing protein [Candidatus Daviesbacteria bacterium]|nr:pilus assembly PilX N-terminal domain-containing protein [Candidatus Daviesbacteria bacterium]